MERFDKETEASFQRDDVVCMFEAADSLARARKDRSEYARQAKESTIISRIGCLVAWCVGWSVGMASTLARE